MIRISSGSSSVASGARRVPVLTLAAVLLAAPVALPVAAQTTTTEQSAQLPDSLIPAGDTATDKQTLKNALKEIAKTQGGGGSANQFCAIMVNSHGQLSPSPEQGELSSMAYGGRPGQIEVVASSSSFSLSIDSPLGFSLAPVGGNDSTVIKTSFSGYGATNFSDIPGNLPVRLKSGATSVVAQLIATKGGGMFPAGQYRAELTLRCE
jgi:hypothetical protein